MFAYILKKGKIELSLVRIESCAIEEGRERMSFVHYLLYYPPRLPQGALWSAMLVTEARVSQIW